MRACSDGVVTLFLILNKESGESPGDGARRGFRTTAGCRSGHPASITALSAHATSSWRSARRIRKDAAREHCVRYTRPRITLCSDRRVFSNSDIRASPREVLMRRLRHVRDARFRWDHLLGYVAVTWIVEPTAAAGRAHTAHALAPPYLPTATFPVADRSKSAIDTRCPLGLRGISFPDVSSRSM